MYVNSSIRRQDLVMLDQASWKDLEKKNAEDASKILMIPYTTAYAKKYMINVIRIRADN